MKKNGFVLTGTLCASFFHNIYKKHIKYNFSNFTNSINYFNQSFSIPIYPSLKTSDQNKIKNLIKNYLNLK